MLALVDRLVLAFAAIAACVLGAVVGLTFVDVVLRYVFSAPILGAQDVLEMSMVVTVFMSAPLAWRSGAHIVVDLLPTLPGRLGATVQALIVRGGGAFVFSLLAWQGWVRADESVLFNEATNMLELPYQPFFIALCVASGFQVVVIVIEIVHLLARGGTVPALRIREAPAATGT